MAGDLNPTLGLDAATFRTIAADSIRLGRSLAEGGWLVAIAHRMDYGCPPIDQPPPEDTHPMSESHPLETTVLKLFAEARDHRLAATSLQTKLATAAKKSGAAHAAAEVDQALTALIDAGKVAVTGGGKTGHHPRPRGSYRLTGAGKDHVKPGKPDASDETLGYQEAYILLQMIRFPDHSASRSKLNEKLKSTSARTNLEFPQDGPKATIDYHLHNLVQAGSLEEERQGVSTIYTLTADGLKALGSADQHETVEFRFVGAALNFLLKAARDASNHEPAAASHQTPPPPEPDDPAPSQAAPAVDSKQIHAYIAQLKADKFAGRDLIPIHEVRALVAHHHGAEAASHPVFDRLLKTMRSEGELEIIAIADNRDATQEQLDHSIPGKNETLFYIVVG